MKTPKGRTPKGSVKAYDKEGNFMGYVFKDWNDKNLYEVRRKNRKESKERQDRVIEMIMNGEIKD